VTDHDDASKPDTDTDDADWQPPDPVELAEVTEQLRVQLLGLYEAERDVRIHDAKARLARAAAECLREEHAAHEEYRARVEGIQEARRQERAS